MNHENLVIGIKQGVKFPPHWKDFKVDLKRYVP